MPAVPPLLVYAAKATLNTRATTPLTQQCTDINNYHTLQAIIYSCLSTIFLCTWAALHMNVPRDPKDTVPLRRMWFMLGALCNPRLVRWLKTILDCGWTELHIQFAQMGGLQVVLDDGTLHRKDFIDCIMNDTSDILV